MTSPNVTGSVQASATTGTSLATAALNVTATDQIVVIVATEVAVGTTCSVTGVTATGLTFAKRWANTQLDTGSLPIRTECWVAPVPSAPGAFNQAITVTVDNAVDSLQIVAFGVGGTNTANPNNSFDPNSGLPYYSYEPSSVSADTVAVTTDQPDDLLLAVVWRRNGGTALPTGFTNIQSLSTFATNFLRLLVSYQVVSAKQAAASISSGETNDTQMIFVDAMTADFTGSSGSQAKGNAYWLLSP